MAARELSGFDPGEKVTATVRASDVHTPGLETVETAKADQRGRVSLTKLKAGVLHWVEGAKTGVRTVLGKDKSWDEDASLHRVGPEATGRRLQADREAQAEAIAEARKKNPLHGSPAPGKTVVDNTPKKRSPSVAEPQPGPRQDEFSGPQRSDTPDGEATPVAPGEDQPDVPQEVVAKGAHQRSSTETGVAAVKDPHEVVPSLRQEDVPKSVQQRSATETGQAEPKPPVRRGEVKKRDDSSVNRARGNTKAKAEEQTTRPPARKTTKTGTRKRPSSKK